MIDLNEHAKKAQETSQKRFAEKALQECQQKNEARAMEGAK